MRANAERKAEHLRVCLEQDVQGQGVTAGFERVRLVHQALPELRLSDVDTSATLAGKRLRSPLVVSAMTGGTAEAEDINLNLAAAAQHLGLAMVVGSQRPAIEDPALRRTYQVRSVAPDILLFANLGAVQLGAGYGLDECRRAVDMIGADGLVLHLNPLQECLQAGGDSDFRRLAEHIATVAASLGLPVMVKEVGWGMSERAALLLREAGVPIVDVAGAGGTSWSEVEGRRAEDEATRRVAAAFLDWGIPTCDAILNVRRVSPETVVVASGGVRTGVDVAKAIALGATAAGLALPLLAPAYESAEAVAGRLGEVDRQLRIAMLCTGSHSLADLPAALGGGPVTALR
ncbi:MAG: type 2 isopentenyl-diphosphate Delta-isomerase [Anaerolineae bacterium]